MELLNATHVRPPTSKTISVRYCQSNRYTLGTEKQPTTQRRALPHHTGPTSGKQLLRSIQIALENFTHTNHKHPQFVKSFRTKCACGFIHEKLHGSGIR